MTKEKKILIAVGKEKISRKDTVEVLKCVNYVKQSLEKMRFSTDILHIEKKDFNNLKNITSIILDFNPDYVFNLFEGFSADSQKEIGFVKLLERIKISFTGNLSYTLNICRNKQKTNSILRKNQIFVPLGFLVKRLSDLDNKKPDFPLFIKPCFEDASLGIDEKSLIERKEDLYKIIKNKLRKFPHGLIVEEFISGKEYNVGLLGNYPYELLGISVLDYKKYKNFSPFMCYTSKWKKDSQKFKSLMPSHKDKMNKALQKKIIDISIKAGNILRCRGYFRVDLREKNGEFFVLDINPNPDINIDSGFMKQAYRKGYTYEKVIEKIIGFTYNPKLNTF